MYVKSLVFVHYEILLLTTRMQYVRQKLCRSYVGYGGAPPDPEIVKNILAGAVGTQRSAQE